MLYVKKLMLNCQEYSESIMCHEVDINLSKRRGPEVAPCFLLEPLQSLETSSRSTNHPTRTFYKDVVEFRGILTLKQILNNMS